MLRSSQRILASSSSHLFQPGNLMTSDEPAAPNVCVPDAFSASSPACVMTPNNWCPPALP